MTTLAARRISSAVAVVARPAVLAMALGTAGVGYRSWLTVRHVPATDSDEAAMGLAALHIAAGHDLPVFLYGQHYMGAIEAYLAAGPVAALGPAVAALRVPTLLLYALFLVLMYRLAARLYPRWYPVLVVGLLALGSDRMVKDQLIAHGGSPELKPLAAGLLLLTLALVDPERPPGPRRYRWCFGAWGAAAGLALWDDWLVLPYVAVAAGLLAAGPHAAGPHAAGPRAAGRHRTSPGRRPWPWLVGGCLLGAAPLLGYNLIAAPGQDSVSVFLRLNAGPPAGMAARLTGGLLWGVPLATGACRPGYCTPFERGWGVLLPVLLVVAGAAAVRAVRRGARQVRQYGRLALVLAALASIAGYARSPAAGLHPLESARYLSVLPVSLPAAVWPLARLATRLPAAPRPARPVAALVVLVLLGGTMVDATAALAGSAGRTAQAYTRQQDLVAALRARGMQRLYADYWTCNRLAFATRGGIACATVGADLHPGWDRYLPMRARVRAASHPGYAFPAGSAEDVAFTGYLTRVGVPAEVVTVAGYHLYRPARRVGIPIPARRGAAGRPEPVPR